MKTIEEKIKCLERELSLRERNYPKWVDEGRRGWTREKADHEITCVKEMLQDYRKTEPELPLQHNPPK